MSEAEKQPKLLCFAGHRNVADKVALGEAIRREVVAMKELLGKRMIVGCCPVAGADLIFLKTCVELRIPAIVILPFSEERFSENFEDAEDWEMAQRLCGVALAKYIAPGEKADLEAYQAVSRLLLEWADTFLFVWNDEPPREAFGTEEVLGEARDLGIPARVINARSLAPKWETPPDPDRRARHGFPSRSDLLDFLDARFGTSK